MDSRKLISIVVPAYNEGECVDELARRLSLVFEAERERYDFEVIIVENGSVDDTYEKLLRIREADPRFTVIQLSRNFLMEGGMIAGLDHAKGDACVIMCADLQDPPELIHEFLRLWEQGYENIYQVVTSREDNSLFRRAAAQTFYWTMDKFSDSPSPRNASDFRLIDRTVYEAFNALTERNRMVRAAWGWLGFRSIGVEHERPPRFGGNTNFKILTTADFAYRGILASSFKLIKLFPMLGFTLSLLSILALVVIVVQALFFGVPFPGFGTLAALLVLLFGFLFFLMGILGEYVGMIFTETRGRPLYVVRHLHSSDD
jgi:glycosyltransferase involved in cell wall biosynthesis